MLQTGFCFFLIAGASALKIHKQTPEVDVGFGRTKSETAEYFDDIDFQKRMTIAQGSVDADTWSKMKDFERLRTSFDEVRGLKVQYVPMHKLEECAANPKVMQQSTDAGNEDFVPDKWHVKLQRKFFTDERLEHLFSKADHIYVICMVCKRVMPKSLVHKTKNIAGKESDRCTGLAGSGHHSRVTTAHRLAVMHAKQNNHKVIAILEEDAVFDTNVHDMDLTSVENLLVDDDRDWEIARFGWYNYKGSVAGRKGCAGNCHCAKWQEKNMCTQDKVGCDFHSSSGYFLHTRAYKHFLERFSRSAIDGIVLSQFHATVIFPPLVHQPSYFQVEASGEYVFIKNCKMH
jgi:hypothetical protein